MWKNPDPIFNRSAPVMIGHLVELEFWSRPFPEFDDAFEVRNVSGFREAYDIVSLIYEDMRNVWIDSDPDQTEETSHLEYRTAQVLKRRVLEVVDLAVKKQDWWLIQRLWLLNTFLCDSLDISLGMKPQAVVSYIVAELVHTLVGSEDRFLVGVKHNTPAWKAATHRKLDRNNLPPVFAIGTDLYFFDSSDIDILPDAEDWIDGIEFMRVVTPVEIPNPWELVAGELEDAYYNQQYLPHPAGSLVRVCGVEGVESVIIKVKKSQYDPNYLELIGVFGLGDKKFVCAISGDVLISREFPEDRCMANPGFERKRMNFLCWLLVKLYHDLVTAKDVVPGQVRKLGKKAVKAAVKLPEKMVSELRWVYIPRQRKKETLEIRRPATNPRSMAPHRVSGHKRRANMTERQREAVQALEQETGIEILRWIPEGYTFVRPHVVPADGSTSLLQLPRFIRTRIQEDVKRLLVVPS